jgi:hypothetical protein
MGGMNWAAVTAWSIASLALMIRMVLLPHRSTTLQTYELAGAHWIEGVAIYRHFLGFVYSPLFAAFFAPLSFLPAAVRPIAWLAVNEGVFLLGMCAVLCARIYEGIPRRAAGLVLLLPLPLALPSLDVA